LAPGSQCVAETRDGMAQHPLFDGSHSIVSKPAGKRSYLHWGVTSAVVDPARCKGLCIFFLSVCEGCPARRR
jgi:hypothetical protein